MKGFPNQSDLPSHIHAAIDEYLSHMQGWTTPQRGQEMAAAILELRHPIAVSIGVYSGRSIIAMGFAMREIGIGMVYGCDPYKVESALEGDGDKEDREWWEKKSGLEKMQEYCVGQIWAHRLDPWVTLIRNGSQHVHQLFPEIGVLEIDGNHSEAASTRDVSLYLPKVISGGYIFADDADWHTTGKAMDMLSAECDLLAEIKPEGNSSYRIYKKR